MKKIFLALSLFISVQLLAQDPASLLDEGKKLEQKLKETEALAKYQEAVSIQPDNIKGLYKLAELNCSIGARTKDEAQKKSYYKLAKAAADKVTALAADKAESWYWMAVVYSKLMEVEEEKEAMVKDIKYTKEYADKAVAIDPAFGKAWHLLGRWNFEIINVNGLKKAAVKVLYGAFPEATIETAIADMEKCKSLEPYYCLNFLDLAKAYEYKKLYEKAIGTLEQLAKLPTRRQDDVAIKAEGAALLLKLQ